ncbi:efflux RND transporter periplasmic adaptor subunit [Flavihumibacter rivuli]|uniref:efflux RND transporter periplasmic adaptor subunit n=1 Tax=Flavihumibacter rivuli TaxID=2838156 RepID=UPI001BDEF36F|nr:efflux RND transporter periplasmic adaptor subunit [Flavihumibacter rivuli]ULQ56501.1 efflux RND transporter periplasmic adaptor subunit [Flavihumibacter rivuli]
MRPLLLFSIMIAFTAISCNHRESSPEQPFSLTDTMLAKISIEEVKEEPVQSELKLNARIIPEDRKMTNVFAVVGGYVTTLNVSLGDYVEKGQVLATIRSTEIAAFEKEYREAQSDLILAEKNQKVAQELYGSKLNTDRDVAAAQKEVDNAQAELQRIKEVMRIYRTNKSSLYNIVAPISGYIIDKKLNANMQLPSSYDESVFTIAELDEVFVSANVYETDISKIKVGMPVEVEMLGYPGKRMKGRIDKILNILDPDSKTLKVNIRMGNPGLMLKPDMVATVFVQYNEGDTMPSVPNEALVFDKSKHYVMVYYKKESIETREVVPYKTSGNRSFIQSGLQTGEKIIGKNALMIYDALND